jgi:hypothetical protein
MIAAAANEWGLALLSRGKPDEAIAQFTLANQKGPHFADPLEGWGEALVYPKLGTNYPPRLSLVAAF